MARAWTKRFAHQVRKLGDNASWYAVWTEPHTGQRKSKSFGPGKEGKACAKIHAKELNRQFAGGVYESNQCERVTWDEFRKRYTDTVLSALAANSLTAANHSLDHLERLCNLKGKPMSSITSATIEAFVAKRRKERGRRPDSTVSVATVAKDLRQIATALRRAVKWKLMKSMPDVEMPKVPKLHKNFVSEEHFAAMYEAACTPELPELDYVTPGCWWSGLLIFCGATGWRIGEVLSLRWTDVDLDAGCAITRAASNKGKRDESVHLAPIVVEHLRRMQASGSTLVFEWPHCRRRMYEAFHAIQHAAAIDLPCIRQDEHTCTDACSLYGFHDLRRAFATWNYGRLSMEQLQHIMRHRSRSTTESYVGYAKRARPEAVDVFIPPVGVNQ